MFTKLRGRKGRLVGILAGLPLAVGLLVGAAQPAVAAPAPVKYVALGDSYTAGQGGGNEEPICFQSTNGYPWQFDALVPEYELVANTACQGSTTATLLTQQLRAVPNRPAVGLVTLTIGGNDAGFGSFGTACRAELTGALTGVAVEPTRECRSLLEINRWETVDLTLRLAVTYLAVRAAFPNAKVVVLGYPYLLPGGTTFTDLLKKAVDDLNRIIENAAATTRVQFVSVTPFFSPGGVFNPAYINLDPVATPIGFLHPTAEGYRAGYAEALRSALLVPAA